MKKVVFLCGIIAFLLTSCTDVEMLLPKGPKGDTGLSAYEFWKAKVMEGVISWPKEQTDIADFFLFLKGKDGLDGQSAYEQWREMIADGSVTNPHNLSEKWPPRKNSVQDFWLFLTGATGERGQTPHIGTNGNWFIGNEDTKIPARGQNGQNAVAPTVVIGPNGNWFIDGVDSGKKALGTDGMDGQDGKSPVVTIGPNGNWFIDGVDSGKKAVGQDGKTPEVAIGLNGHWFINGVDSGKSAYGEKGADGTNGKNTYELWKEYISSGNVDDPHTPGGKWPASKNTQADFWSFISGKTLITNNTIIPEITSLEIIESMAKDNKIWRLKLKTENKAVILINNGINTLSAIASETGEFETDIDRDSKADINYIITAKAGDKQLSAPKLITVTQAPMEKSFILDLNNIHKFDKDGKIANDVTTGVYDPVEKIFSVRMHRDIHGGLVVPYSGMNIVNVDAQFNSNPSSNMLLKVDMDHKWIILGGSSFIHVANEIAQFIITVTYADHSIETFNYSMVNANR